MRKKIYEIIINRLSVVCSVEIQWNCFWYKDNCNSGVLQSNNKSLYERKSKDSKDEEYLIIEYLRET